MTWRAFVDESYAQLTSHYLMAAVVLDDTTSQGVSDLARGLRRRASGAFHWRHELDASRRTMLDLIALVSDAQVVVVSKPVPGRRQVTGHKPVPVALVSEACIRIDTSGGCREPLTACLLRDPEARPIFVRSDSRMLMPKASPSSRV